MIQAAPRPRQRLSLLGQLDPARGRDEKLRADRVLQALDLAAHPRLAGVGNRGGAVERLGLGHGEKDAQLSPELSTEQCLVVEWTLVECVLFLVECLHGFPDRVERTNTYSLAVFFGKSPFLCRRSLTPWETRSPSRGSARGRRPSLRAPSRTETDAPSARSSRRSPCAPRRRSP